MGKLQACDKFILDSGAVVHCVYIVQRNWGLCFEGLKILDFEKITKIAPFEANLVDNLMGIGVAGQIEREICVS